MDYLIDYEARRIVMGAPGTLPSTHGGHRTALSWAEGLPAVTAEIRAEGEELFPARVVLDSGTDHVTLFGRAAERMLAGDQARTVRVDSGFGTRDVPTAMISINIGGRRRSAVAALMRDVTDRQEDGLVPTSFFRSVLVRGAEGMVVFDAPASNRSRVRLSYAPC